MHVVSAYLIGSTTVGWVTGIFHGIYLHPKRPDIIVMSGLQGMMMGPYAPIIIPYVALSGTCVGLSGNRK
jgi:hypothetical protein